MPSDLPGPVAGKPKLPVRLIIQRCRGFESESRASAIMAASAAVQHYVGWAGTGTGSTPRMFPVALQLPCETKPPEPVFEPERDD